LLVNTGFLATQVAEVIVTRADGSAYRGSGYQISADVVMTAAHVVANARSIQVRMDADSGDEFKSIATRRWLDVKCDIALLTMARERGVAIVDARFAKLGDDHETIEAHAAGFPLWKLRTDEFGDQFRDFLDATGTISAISNRRSRTLELTVPPPADSPDPEVSPWGAMSGAAVWVGRRIVGVVSEHYRREGLNRLTAKRIEHVLRVGVDETDGRSFSEALGIQADSLPLAGAAQDDVLVTTSSDLDLRVYRVPSDWQPDGFPCPVSDGSVVDLGAILCLDRGPSTTVVAAQPGIGLAEALTAVEQGVIRQGSGPGLEFGERVWREVTAHTAEGVVRAAEVPPGLVLRTTADQDRARAAQFCEQVRAIAPAPIVVLVESDDAVEAIASAVLVARQVRATAAGRRAEVVSHTRPGGTLHDSAKGGLLAELDAGMRKRSLQPPLIPSGADDSAVGVVELLNRYAFWGSPRQEALAIGLVRDFAPDYFGALVREHARHRDGSARWASLAAAASIDDYVTVWLDAVGEVGDPASLPRDLRSPAVFDAVVLGLIRRGSEVLASWVDAVRNRRPAAVQIADHLAAGRSATDFLREADPEAVIAAGRAGQFHLLTATVTSPEGSPAWWAVLGRSPLTERSVAVLASLSVESRQVAGFTTQQVEPDPAFADLAHELRIAMFPPPPVKESLP
jgi:hypothetical protein